MENGNADERNEPVKDLLARQFKKWTKIILGAICLLSGIIMLATPGQGILFILIGFKLLREEVPWLHTAWLWIRRHLPPSWVARGDKIHDRAHRWISRWKARWKAWLRSRRKKGKA